MRTRTLLLGCWVRCAMQVPRFKGPRATYTARAGLADAICACVNLGGVGATGACQLMLLWLDAPRACNLFGCPLRRRCEHHNNLGGEGLRVLLVLI